MGAGGGHQQLRHLRVCSDAAAEPARGVGGAAHRAELERGINGGAFFFLRLPNSGLELDLPLIGQFPDGDRVDAGLQPDILVTPTVDDISSGRDAELDAVLARLRRPRSP